MAKECLCDRCSALCCRYFALQIDTPTTPSAFDDIRWYILHEGVHIFVEKGLWFLSVQTRCTHLTAENRCGIHEDRPQICRSYSTENCDFYIGAYEFEQYFTSADQLEAFAQATLGKKYERYVLAQRAKNTGKDGRATKGLDKHAVMHARKRTRIMGHPTLRPAHGHPPKSPASANSALVPLSISRKTR